MLALSENSSYTDKASRHTASHLDVKGNDIAAAGGGILPQLGHLLIVRWNPK